MKNDRPDGWNEPRNCVPIAAQFLSKLYLAILVGFFLLQPQFSAPAYAESACAAAGSSTGSVFVSANIDTGNCSLGALPSGENGLQVKFWPTNSRLRVEYLKRISGKTVTYKFDEIEVTNYTGSKSDSQGFTDTIPTPGMGSGSDFTMRFTEGGEDYVITFYGVNKNSGNKLLSFDRIAVVGGIFGADTTPPILSNVPEDVTREADGTNPVPVRFSATANDAVDGSVKPVFTFFDGLGGETTISYAYSFPVGVTVVNVTATDSAGNRTFDSFTVTIIEGEGPELDPVSIVSNNTEDTSLAKEGDTITLRFTASETLDVEPDVTIAGQSANVTNTPNTNEYTATINVDSSTPEGLVEFLISDLEDEVGNTGDEVSGVTGGSFVIVDRTAPILTSVSIESDNTTDTSFATVGDIITLRFTASETLGAEPDVKIAGQPASLTNTPNTNEYTATFEVKSNTDAGPVEFLISGLRDEAGNIGDEVSGVSEGPTLTVDSTVPSLSSVSIESSKTADTSLAAVGDTITLSFISDEALGATPVVTIADEVASVVNTPNTNEYTATIEVISNTKSGLVSFLISGLEDEAGNPANDVSDVTDKSSVTVDSAAPTVEILDAPDTIEDLTPFAIRVVFSEEVTGFELADITVGNGSASNLTTSDNIRFTADITPDGSGDTTLDVLAGAAQDLTGNDNTAAEQVVIENKIVEITKQVIANFMLNRANFLLGNQPDIAGLLGGTHGNGGGSLGNLALAGNEFGMELAFATSLSKIDREQQQAIKQRVAEAHQFAGSATGEGSLMGVYGADIIPSGVEGAAIIPPTQSNSNPYGTVPSRRYDLWTEVYGATSTTGDNESSYWVGYLGGHYFVSEDLLIGGLVQLDWSEEEDSIAGSAADGFGWMVGPYIAGTIPDTTLSWDLRAAWGRSDNNVNPIGSYTDDFETERWLVSGKVQGSFDINELIITPTLQGSWFEETQQTYTDSLGNVISAQTISLGELKFGPEFSMNKVLENGMVVSPSVALSGVWNFGINDNAASQGYVLGDDEVRARVDLGIDLRDAKGRSLALSGYYDGLGIDDYEAMGGEVRLSIPFQ